MGLRGGIGKSRRRSGQRGSGRSYESMMKTLLLQNQQIIIQQQNMMFMVMKQFHPEAALPVLQPQEPTTGNQLQHHPLHQSQMQQPVHSSHLQHAHHSHHHHQQSSQHQQQQQQQQHHQQQHQQLSSMQQEPQQRTNGGHLEQQEQQRITNLQDTLGSFMTPAASEQDPISENGKPEHESPEGDALSALLESDGLLTNNLLYNPCTDVGSITPYKNHHVQGQQQPSSQQQSHHHTEHQTPSYYSSGCESLSTPRVEQQCQPVSISQNVVKNLNNSFKSPSKPQINVQILSGSATREMRKAKIIQSMNISEFLRQVHHDDAQKSATQ